MALFVCPLSDAHLSRPHVQYTHHEQGGADARRRPKVARPSTVYDKVTQILRHLLPRFQFLR
jgi:hypothetical protein